MSHKFETLLYAILFTVWSIRLYYKIYDKKTRKYILAIGILIVLLMIIRISKSIVVNLTAQRYCWYFYYVSLIFIPTIFYIYSCNDQITKIKRTIIYFVSSILLLLVLTNDYHQLVFKFKVLNDYDNYKHQIGYYITSIWIFYNFGHGMINLALNRLKIKKDFKLFLPLIILFIGIIYTILYVLNIKYIRDINMTVFNSILICIGIELSFYLELIPNNSKYIKTFENSHLNMLITSKDTKVTYYTKTLKTIPQNILKDIKKANIKHTYQKNNMIYNVKNNKDSYVITKKDLTYLNKLKQEIKTKNKELLKQQESIKLKHKIQQELYEVNLRKTVIKKIENKLKEKTDEAQKILNKKEITKNDLEQIKRIIIYSKKKSELMISEINSEYFNNESIKLIINELIISMKSLNITGLTIIKNKLNIRAGILSTIYDLIYDILENIHNTTLMIYISNDNNNYILKVVIGSKISLKSKLKLDKNIKLIESIYDTDTQLLFNIRGEL